MRLPSLRTRSRIGYHPGNTVKDLSRKFRERKAPGSNVESREQFNLER